jgi:hypothetical protein
MEDLSRYYTLLRDPTRRRIIEIPGGQEKIGFKELRATLGLGVGTVYYHLDMLSGFVVQDKQRKYRLNDRGKMLYSVFKDGNVPPTLEIGETFSHRFGRWLFLSPVFDRTVRSLKVLPLAIAILLVGMIGSAYVKLDPALFFYFPYSVYSSTSIMALYLSNWLGLFLFAEIFTYLVYRRVGNEVQLFACLAIASFPVAVFPYIYLVLSNVFSQYLLIVLQFWGLLLVTASFCFGKGIRLDKAIIVSFSAMYLNIAVLFVL